MSAGIIGSSSLTTKPGQRSSTSKAATTKYVKTKTKTAVVTKKAPVGNKGNSGSTTSSSVEKKPPVYPDFGYQWNLPPHQWSLPVQPSFMANYDGIDSKGPANPAANRLNVPDGYRRGRIWYWVNDPTTVSTTDGKTDPTANKDRKYGFQFMWNPESYSTSVTLNTDVTISPTDRFASVAGAFPSGETMSIELHLDRTNDFACARKYISKNYNVSAPPATGKQLNNGGLDAAQVSNNLNIADLAQYYTQNGAYDSNYVSNEKLMDLLKYGTVADIEYLYKAINGPGWHNVAGRETSDIGYLAATLVRIDLGPMAFVGYINGMQVNHTRFSTDMTPISTDLTLSINLMASAGLTSTGTAAAVAVTP